MTRRLGTTLLLTGALLAILAGPAWPHAGAGELMYVWWEPADGREITGRFTAPADDAAEIGTVVGVLREGAMQAVLDGDEAALPTAQERAELARSPALEAYLLEHIRVVHDGQPCPGQVRVDGDLLVDGAELRFTCPAPVTTAEVTITVLTDVDPGYETLSGDGTLQDARHTAAAPTHTWDFTLAAAEQRRSALPWPGWLPDDRQLEPRLLALLDRAGQGGLLLVGALLLAALVGAAHALGPGHGKLLVGAYLASSDGRVRDAVGLGGLVALMHTGAVLALGLVFLLGQQLPTDARLEAGATIVAGALTTVVGAVTVRARWRGWRGNHDHAHTHTLPAGVSPLSRTGLVAIATAGGLVPSPAALLVLATAFALGRAGVGVALVAAFGLGLGATLTGIGLAVLWGRQRLDRAADRHGRAAGLSRAVPVVAAGLVMLGGAVLVLLGALRW